MNDIEKCDKAWCLALANCVGVEDIYELTGEMVSHDGAATLDLRNQQWHSAVSCELSDDMAKKVFITVIQARKMLADEAREEAQPPPDPGKVPA